MFKLLLRAFAITLGMIGPAMAQERILIASDWGKVTAELVDNNATRSLVQMLPLTIEMRDHLRQEKTGNLPSPWLEVSHLMLGISNFPGSRTRLPADPLGFPAVAFPLNCGSPPAFLVIRPS